MRRGLQEESDNAALRTHPGLIRSAIARRRQARSKGFRQTRNRIGALNADDGTATAFDPNADARVESLAVSGTTVYAGGYFNMIGGQARNYIAALDADDGTATAFDPNPNGIVLVVAVSGRTVSAGGYFSVIGLQTRNNIAALDAARATAVCALQDRDGAAR